MGNRLGANANINLEYECVVLDGFIALDASSNVIGFAPTATPLVLAGPGNNLPYTRFRGLQIALGPAGGVLNQPHTGTGLYNFTLDEPWFGCLEQWIQLNDQGAVAGANYFVDVNATNTTGSTNYGWYPGQNQSLAAQTVKVTFRTAAAGALVNPVASTGWSMGLTMKRNAPQ